MTRVAPGNKENEYRHRRMTENNIEIAAPIIKNKTTIHAGRRTKAYLSRPNGYVLIRPGVVPKDL